MYSFRVIILGIFLTAFGNSIAQNLHLPCKFPPNIEPVDLSPPSLTDITRFFEYQKLTPQIIDDALLTEAEILKMLEEYNGGADNEDVHMYITKLIEKYGYPAEEHEVETEDGYLLTMQRIPNNGSVVFLMHALFSSADDFVTAGKESALAYYLADRGYDVWMGNARGNKHSRKHVSISPDCAEFWDFSFDEVGRYDVSAMIDYVLNYTGKEKLSYVGHALGNTAFFVMASELPEYNDKISIMITLCPTVYMQHVRSIVFRLLALQPNVIYNNLRSVGLVEIVSANPVTEALTSVVCGNNALANALCSNLVYVLFGFDLGNQNLTNLAVNFGHTPAGASTKQVIHYGQLVQSGKFRQFEYTRLANLKIYKKFTAPEYPLHKVTAPVALFYSNTDWISNVTDVEKLRDALPNVVDYTLFDHYWHFDYIWATNVNEGVNPKIVQLVEKYRGEN